MAMYQWRADAFQPMSDEYIYCFLEHEQQAIRGAVSYTHLGAGGRSFDR